MASIDWHHLPPLSALRAFEATARLEGFSAAARALNVTPAAVAQQVRGLEAHLGTPLVRRAGRGLTLTDAGARLAARLGEGFSTIASGVEDLRQSERTRGLRVLTTTFIVDAMIMPGMSDFWQKHPGTEVAFTPGLCHTDVTLDLFESQGYDVIIMSGSGDWPGVEAELMLECPMLVVGTPELFRRAGDDLLSVPWIWDPDDNFIKTILHALTGKDTDRLERIDAGNPRLEMAAARAGHGLTLASEVVARPELRSGALMSFPTPRQYLGRYYITTPPGPRRPAVANFVDWLHTLADEWRADRPQPPPARQGLAQADL